MNYTNILSIAVCFGLFAYCSWLFFESVRLSRNALTANSASEVLAAVVLKRRFYCMQTIISFVALVVLVSIKALLFVNGKFEENFFSVMVFGNATDEGLVNRIGWGGVGLCSIGALCWYQQMKAIHYFQVLYAFRKQIGLVELDKPTLEK